MSLKCWLCLPLLAGLALGYLLLVQTTGNAQPGDDRIADLVKQLGSAKYAEREKAKKELETIGLPALDQLRKASNDGDLETRKRCQELVKKLEDRMASDSLIAPKKVKLSFKDTPVMQAVEELQRQSGYQIIVEGDRVPLAKRKITLETGEVTFWEAFDKLCKAANLAEVPTGGGNPSVIYYDLDNVIQIMPINKQLPPVPVQPAQPGQQPALPPPPVKGGLNNNPGLELQVQIQLPAAAGNGQAAVAQIAVPVQLAQPAQPAQAGGAGQPGQPGKPAIAKDMPAVIQIQPLPVQGQAQPLPAIQPRPVQGRPTPSRAYQPGQIVVRDGTPESYPTSYHGALRIRLMPLSKATEIAVQPPQKGEVVFVLEVNAEPRLQGFSIAGAPRLDKALDDQGQDLALVMEPMPPAGQPVVGIRAAQVGRVTTYSPVSSNGAVRQVALRLKLGDKQAKTLKELKGVLNVQALSAQPEAFITVNDIMKSAGKTVNGAQGGAIEVIKMDKNKNGVYSVKFRLEQPPQFHPATNLNGVLPAAGAGGGGVGVGAKAVGGGALAVAQQIQIQPAQATTAVGFAPMSQGLPVLLDAKGKPLTQISMSSSGRSANGVFVQEITLNFRPDNGAGEPTQFVLFGHRMVNAQVPFQFEKVQLP